MARTDHARILVTFFFWVQSMKCSPPSVDETLQSIIANSRELTITSFLYNPTSAYSAWVDHVFGSKSVFYGDKFVPNVLGEVPLSEEEVRNRFTNISDTFALPDYALWPPCSIELLGYVPLDIQKPFMAGTGRDKPIFGNGVVHISNSILNESWNCFYRPNYENWRTEQQVSAPNYWAVIFYCPAQNAETSCANMEKLYFEEKTRLITVDMNLEHGNWKTSFSANVVSKDTVAIRTSRSMKIPLAICTVIPYTSTDTDKVAANGALLIEWIKYHAMLGMKVIIYDRDGANREHIFSSAYAKSQGININKLDLVYHNYTIRGLLDSSRKGMHYDNTEAAMDSKNKTEAVDRLGRYQSQGHDKTLTLTHCRFEAKALYGLDNVMISDFDEFFYCSAAVATKESQRQFLKRYLEYHRRAGVQQLMFPQRLVLPTEASARDCVVEKVKQGRSLYDCFTPFEFYMGGHSSKSVHLGHTCPLTGYHQACPSYHAPRFIFFVGPNAAV